MRSLGWKSHSTNSTSPLRAQASRNQSLVADPMTKKDEGKRTSYSSFTAKKAEKRSRGEEARFHKAKLTGGQIVGPIIDRKALKAVLFPLDRDTLGLRFHTHPFAIRNLYGTRLLQERMPRL